MILVRAAPALEVYWVERAPALAYLGGFHAFPGGRVSRQDALVKVLDVADDVESVRRAAAAREIFEEIGVLFVRPQGGSSLPPGTDERNMIRVRLDDGSVTFASFLSERQFAVDGAALVPAGRWLSPDFTPRGFDTRFYLAVCPDGEEPSVIAGELTRGEWIEPHVAHAGWERGQYLLASPVRRGLEVLAQCSREWAESNEPAANLRKRLDEWAPRFFDTPEARGGPIERVEILPGAVLVPLPSATIPPATHTNAYVLGSGECLLVDPGGDSPAAHAELERVLDGLKEAGRRVTAISVTHGHPDHTAGVAEWRRRLGVPVLAHPQLARSLEADRVLVDGESIALAGEPPWAIEVHFTPGHTQDSVVFFERARGVLIAGDLVSGLSTTVIDPPEGDLADYLQSLERLEGWPVRALFPGHGPPSGGVAHRLRALIEHRRWRESRVIEALAEGPSAIDLLVPRVYSDTPETQWPWARRSLLAYLLALERQGKARRESGPASEHPDARPDESGTWALLDAPPAP